MCDTPLWSVYPFSKSSMPGTHPSMSCVARMESIPGTSTPGTSESATHSPPFSKPSAAAIFMGWYFATSTPEWSPLNIRMPVPRMPTTAATRMLARAKRTSRRFNRYHALTPMTKMAPVIHPLDTEWKNLTMATGLVTNAQKSTIS